MFQKIPCTLMRGGTSKGLFFQKIALPFDPKELTNLILSIMGSPDSFGTQINGMGGGSSSTSKVAIINKSEFIYEGQKCHIDYLFGQVSVGDKVVDFSGNCGNMTAAVGVYAIYHKLIDDHNQQGYNIQRVRIYQKNTNQIIDVNVQCYGNQPLVHGDFILPGIQAPGSEIKIDFIKPGFGESSLILPTGNASDILKLSGKYSGQQIEASLVSVGNPTIFISSDSIDLQGTENSLSSSCLDLMENIRCVAAVKMGLGSDPDQVSKERPATPKIAFVSKQQRYQSSDGKIVQEGECDIVARIISMGKLHHAFTATGSIALSTACLLPNSIPNQFYSGTNGQVRIGHRSGVEQFKPHLSYDGNWKVHKVSFSKTAKILMDGFVLDSQI